MERKSNKSRKSNSGRSIFRPPRSGLRDGDTWSIFGTGMPKSVLPTGNNEIEIVKTIDLGVVQTTSVTLPTFSSLTFALSSLPEVSSYTAVFDQYRVEELESWILPESNNTTDSEQSQYYSVLDYDDSTNLTSVAAALNYDNSVIAPLTIGMYRRLKPRMAMAAYSGSFTSYANSKATWIDCGSTGVIHYGIKIAADPSIAITVPIRAFIRARIRFRATR